MWQPVSAVHLWEMIGYGIIDNGESRISWQGCHTDTVRYETRTITRSFLTIISERGSQSHRAFSDVVHLQTSDLPSSTETAVFNQANNGALSDATIEKVPTTGERPIWLSDTEEGRLLGIGFGLDWTRKSTEVLNLHIIKIGSSLLMALAWGNGSGTGTVSGVFYVSPTLTKIQEGWVKFVKSWKLVTKNRPYVMICRQAHMLRGDLLRVWEPALSCLCRGVLSSSALPLSYQLRCYHVPHTEA